MLVGAPNDSLRLSIINYMFKYTFGFKTTLLDSLRNQKKAFKGSISAKLLNNFVLTRIESLRHIGAPNESPRLIIIDDMFKYTFGNKTTLLKSFRNNNKTPLKARFTNNLSKGLSFCA